MGIENAPTGKGKEASRRLHEATRDEEHDVEAAKGSELAKGPDRVDERSRASDGKDPGTKQKL